MFNKDIFDGHEVSVGLIWSVHSRFTSKINFRQRNKQFWKRKSCSSVNRLHLVVSPVTQLDKSPVAVLINNHIIQPISFSRGNKLYLAIKKALSTRNRSTDRHRYKDVLASVSTRLFMNLWPLDQNQLIQLWAASYAHFFLTSCSHFCSSNS